MLPTNHAAARPRYTSHQHVFTVIKTMLESGAVRATGTVRLLEIGCGDGHLLNFLQARLPSSFPCLRFELHGFDVTDQGYADQRQKEHSVALLSRHHPGIDWADRIRVISDHGHWGYPDGMFDFAISHTVLEHVDDLDSFLDNIKRVVRTDGATIHFFPLRDCLMEGHAKVPFAHLVRNFESRVALIRWMNRIGIGRYAFDRKVLGHASLQEHASETAKFIQCWTYYRSFRQIYEACYARGLAISYDYTKDFFFQKLRSLFRIRPVTSYARSRIPGGEWLCFTLFKHVAAVTLTIRPIQHDVGARVKLEKDFRRGADAQSAPSEQPAEPEAVL